MVPRGFVVKGFDCISVGIPKESDGELRELVLHLQQHHHTSTCRKTTHRRRNVAECWFDFPRPLCEETHLKSHDDPGNRSRCYLLKRSAGEENINPYNEHLLRAWQANMDIQLIGSVSRTAAYVCSYMCKGESEEVRKAIREALESLPTQASSRKRLSKVGNTMLTHRELSAQEAAYRLCHLPLKENSRKVVFLNTARPEKRTRLLKSRSDLLQLEDDEEGGTTNADTLHDDDDAIGALSRQTLSERDYRQLVSSLNEHQRVPFDRVVRYTRELHQYKSKYVMIPLKLFTSL